MKRTPGGLILCFILAGCPALAAQPRSIATAVATHVGSIDKAVAVVRLEPNRR